MKKHPIKQYPTLGCCGLDCGLCPRYYTAGSSRCPGCCGPDFFDKHPSCSFITCCVKRRGLEVCAECDEFPCLKFELEGENAYDSFITHRKTIFNLDFIKEDGMEKFMELQEKRIELLGIMLKHYNDGRAKSFYCLAATLLSIVNLERALETVGKSTEESDNIKIRAKSLRQTLDEMASQEGVRLKLRKKVK